MKRVLVPLANGFEEIEAITIIDILRRAKLHVVAAGVGGRTIVGSHRIAVVADRALEEVAGEDFELIALPGGMSGTTQLLESATLGEMLVRQNEAGRWIAAICAAPMVLEKHGLLKDRKVTSHFSVKEEIKTAAYAEERVVHDGNLITSQGAGTAIEFALKLVELLCGPETAGRIANATRASALAAVPVTT